MKPAMIMAGALWITVALCVASMVIGRDHLGLLGIGLMGAVTVYVASMAVDLTRCWLYGISHPLVLDDRVKDLRRRRSHGRFVGSPR